jgi:hypothetical protein
MPFAVEPLSVDAGHTVTISERGFGPAAGAGSWWAWECPCCGSSYEAELDACIEDGSALRKVGFSLPFIWIG